MEIRYGPVLLRDTTEADVEDYVRWMTRETQWQVWETPESIANFPGEEAYRARMLQWIREPKGGHRWSFEIDTAAGEHIGEVNSYLVDEDLAWTDREEGDDPSPDARIAIGIFIYESGRWSRGYGAAALTAFVQYLLSEDCGRLYLGTYSANRRMLGLADKLGFRECKRQKGVRTVRGESWDEVTLQLDREAFGAYLEGERRALS